MKTGKQPHGQTPCDLPTFPVIKGTLKNDLKTLKRLAESKPPNAIKRIKKTYILKQPVKPKLAFKPKARLSTSAGWSRAFTKYSPSKEITASPVKASQTNLQRTVLKTKDLYIEIATWVVNMSEQFYYDNSILLLNSSKSDKHLMMKMIRRNYKSVDIEFFNNLKNIFILGTGGFGSVYSATDEATSKTYAVKYISSKHRDMVKHCESILDYMSERNSIIRAMNSPFVTNFYYSLQLKSIGGIFLFFEYCIGDLSTYIDKIEYDYPEDISKRINRHEREIIQDLDKNINVLDVSLMYMFELFCGLDFLVKANIIHQDIKPGNLMVSETLHLKIGDFGLIYRTRTIHRDTNRQLVKVDKMNTVESSNYEVGGCGTVSYMDLETLLMDLEEDSNPLFTEVMEDKKYFDIAKLRYNDEILIPTFLIDTWAAGIVSIQLLFRGFHIFDPDMMSSSVLSDLPKDDMTEFTIHVVGRRSIFHAFIEGGLRNSGGRCHKELMEFIISIFRPREVRAKGYTKQKTIYQLTSKVDLRYVDMDKIEKLKSFKVRNFTTQNIITFKVPEKIRLFFDKKRKKKFHTFKNMIDDYSKKYTGKQLIELEPGMAINYFH